MTRLIFIVIGMIIVARLYVLEGSEAAIVSLFGVLGLASMVWFSDFWANTILRVGFWESKATDYKSAQNSAPAIVFLAWVLLVLFAILVAVK